MRVKIISPERAAKDGYYKWAGARNDCKYFGEVPGYELGFTMEVSGPNGLDYTSVFYVDGEPKDISCAMDRCALKNWTVDQIAAECCARGLTPTGRLVFRGYYESYYDFEEREECVRCKSDEVKALFSKYVKEDR